MAGWVAAQAIQLAAIRDSFGSLPVWEAPYAAAEPMGVAALTAFGSDLYGTDDPAGPIVGAEPIRVSQTADGFALHLAMPFVTRGEIDLARHGDELVITVGSHRRVLTLPSGLQRCHVEGARLVDGFLVVRFVPNPDLWMRRP
jgi:arsenite-transporting ATPase